MTSSDFSSCCSLTINIFESPPLEQHVFNCASHVVLSNAMKLSHIQSLFCSVDRGRRCEEHLVRALLVQRRQRQLAAVRRLQADGTQLQRPAGQGGTEIFLCQKTTKTANCPGPVQLQQLPPLWLRHPPRFSPQTSSDRDQRGTCLLRGQAGFFCQ